MDSGLFCGAFSALRAPSSERRAEQARSHNGFMYTGPLWERACSRRRHHRRLISSGLFTERNLRRPGQPFFFELVEQRKRLLWPCRAAHALTVWRSEGHTALDHGFQRLGAHRRPSEQTNIKIKNRWCSRSACRCAPMARTSARSGCGSAHDRLSGPARNP